MKSRATIHFLTPTYHPYGGVVKLLDYAAHALALGYRASIYCPEPFEEDAAIFRIERLRNALVGNDQVRFHSRKRLGVKPRDLVLMSIPTDFDLAANNLPEGSSPERVIHLVQNTRHVNPHWLGGQPLRTLTRPAARLATSPVIADVIRPWVDRRGLLEVNTLGHDLGVFAHQRSGGLGQHGPIRVLHTTWKSDIGDVVASRLAGDDRFEFQAVRGTTEWADLRDRYSWSEVFLSTPNPQEGTYLPGLEAMAAGSLVVTPDVGGNMDYCRPGENCLLVEYGDVDGYCAALAELASTEPPGIEKLRDAAYAITANFGLDRERAGFAAFLDELVERIEAFEQPV